MVLPESGELQPPSPLAHMQWHSKVLRGPGSTVTLGPLSCFAPARSAESGVGLWVKVMIMRLPPESSPILVPSRLTSPRNSKANIGSEGAE